MRLVPQKCRTALRILKNAEKSTSSDFFHKAWRDAEGRQFVCDGCQAVALNTPLPLPENSGPQPALEKTILALNGVNIPLEFPYSLAELKEFKAIHDAQQKKYVARKRESGCFTFGEDAPDVNINYLINILEILPGAKLSYAKQHGKRSPIYFESPDGRGILLSVINRKAESYVNA